MIMLEKLGKDKKNIVINAELIETIEEIPETLINLTTGRKIMVKESKEKIIELVKEYKRSIFI